MAGNVAIGFPDGLVRDEPGELCLEMGPRPVSNDGFPGVGIDIFAAKTDDINARPEVQQRDFRLATVGNADRRVQGDGLVHKVRAVLRHPVASQEITCRAGAVDLEGAGAVVVRHQRDVVEYRRQVEQFAVRARSRCFPTAMAKK